MSTWHIIMISLFSDGHTYAHISTTRLWISLIKIFFNNCALSFDIDRFWVPVILAIVCDCILYLEAIRFKHIDHAFVKKMIRVNWILLLRHVISIGCVHQALSILICLSIKSFGCCRFLGPYIRGRHVTNDALLCYFNISIGKRVTSIYFLIVWIGYQSTVVHSWNSFQLVRHGHFRLYRSFLTEYTFTF